MTALRARVPLAFPGRFPGACDPAAIRGELLYAGKTADVMDCIERHEGQDVAHPRDRTQAVAGIGAVLLGTLDDRPLQGAQSLVVGGHQRSVDLDPFLHGGLGKALGDASAVGFVGEVLAALG
jgi:hypothetical protein